MKFYGKVGYAVSSEIKQDVWEDSIIEKEYSGDVLRNYVSVQSSDKINDDISFSNRISIVADNYLLENVGTIRYIEWLGSRWKVSSFEVQRPRIIFSLGGLYNGPTSKN